MLYGMDYATGPERLVQVVLRYAGKTHIGSYYSRNRSELQFSRVVKANGRFQARKNQHLNQGLYNMLKNFVRSLISLPVIASPVHFDAISHEVSVAKQTNERAAALLHEAMDGCGIEDESCKT